MSEELEDLLKRFTIKPGSRVKKAVLSRFAETFEHGGEPEKKPGFWMKPIPVYVFLALLIAAAGISFIAGRSVSRPEVDSQFLSGSPEDPGESAGDEVTWVVTPADFI
jgi:hypothetical protein